MMDFKPEDPENELYLRGDYFKVFISSKMAGGAFAAERAEAIKAVEELPIARAWAWERDSIGGSYYSEEECIRQAGSSEAIVLLLADELTRVTAAEYEAAHRSGANAIVLVQSGAELSQDLRTFIHRARRDGVTKEFSDLGELRSHIATALWNWTLRAGRRSVLDLRDRRANAERPSSVEAVRMRDESGREASLGEFVEEAQTKVSNAQGEEALEHLYYLAAVAIDDGLIVVSRFLIDSIAAVIPPDAIDQQWEAWILNIRGRLASATTDYADAKRFFEHMRQIGVATADQSIEATALQNLGIQDSLVGDRESARSRFDQSLKIKIALDDAYGGIQVLLNVVTILLDDRKLDEAEEVLTVSKTALDYAPYPDLLATLNGQRGLLATRKSKLDPARQYFRESLKYARRAKSPTREIEALQSLGANASERKQDREGIRWHRKALSLARAAEDLRQQQIQLAAIGNAQGRLEEWDAAVKSFKEAAELAGQLRDARTQAECIANSAACLAQSGDHESALSLINQVLAESIDAEPSWRSEQLRNLGEVLADLGRPGEAIGRFEQAANLVPDPERSASALRRAGEIALRHPGLSTQAPDLLRRAFELMKPSRSSSEWAWDAAGLGALLSGSAQNAHSIPFFSMALRVFSRNGDQRRAFFTRNDRSIARGHLGDLAGAVQDLKAAIEIAESIPDRELTFQGYLNLGEIERRRGRYECSDASQARALELAAEAGNRGNQAAVMNMIGLLRVDQEDFEEAAAFYSDALSIGRDLRDPRIESSALGGLGGIAFRAAHYGEAERRYRQAIRVHDAEPSTALVEDLGSLVMTEAARGKVDEATLQRFIDVSGVLGWDLPASGELGWAARARWEAGDEDVAEAVSLLGAALVCALREMMVRESEAEVAEGAAETFAKQVSMGLFWLRGEEEYFKWKKQLIDEVSRAFGLDEELGLLVDTLKIAEDEIDRFAS